MDILQTIVILLISLTLHELMHALASDWLGDTTARREGRISLNPLAHIDPFATLLLPALLILAGSPVVFAAAKPVPFNPWAVRYGKWGVAIVAASGPLTNLALASFLALWLRLFPLPLPATKFFLNAIMINIAFFVFNMIPFPPLDGSRLLYAVMPRAGRDIMDKIERLGLVAVFIFLFVGYPFIAPYMSSVIQFIARTLVPAGSL